MKKVKKSDNNLIGQVDQSEEDRDDIRSEHVKIPDDFNSELTLTGKFTKFIFGPKEDGFLVGVLVTADDETVAVGNLVDAQLDKLYTLNGDFVYNEKYGEQYSFHTASVHIPNSTEGIKLFLSSGIIKGVGEKKAAEIVDRFGDKTLDIIKNQSERLLEISGIGNATMNSIAEAVSQELEMAEVYMKLQKFNLGDKIIGRLYREYGSIAADVILENPYTLISDITGVGFKKADEIAEKIGIEKDNPLRVQSGIKHYLTLRSRDGHCFEKYESVISDCSNLITVPREKVEEAIYVLGINGEIKIEENRVYLMKFYESEEYSAAKIVELLQSKNMETGFGVDNLIRHTESEYGIEFSDEQKNGIKESLRSGVSVVTGGPGTGKTTIIRGIINIIKSEGSTLALTAPTGRAAKRISETTGEEAMTIHRLLEYNYSANRDVMYFERNETNPLKYDVIIVDEASMLDLILLEHLLKAVSLGTKLIFVGDVNQLPSVNVGNVLRDIIDSKAVPCYELKEIFRQAEESAIVVNAHKINMGELPDISNKCNDFFFGRRLNEKDALSEIINLCDGRLEKFFKVENKIMDIQVLTPMQKGRLGSISLNQHLQKALNGRAHKNGEPALKKGDYTYFIGDKVMQIKNNYDMKWVCKSSIATGEGVFNGDIGYVENIDLHNGKMSVVFDGDKYVNYDMEQLEELSLAYAMTIHKSQGSEFPIVVMPVMRIPEMLGTRNLLYTGVTRGKSGVVMVGNPSALQKMIENNNIKNRNSYLATRIKNAYEFFEKKPFKI